jgi:hypothetical protein
MVERTELKINGMCQVRDSLHHQKCIIYYVIFPREAHYEESAANHQSDRSVPGDTAECCSAVAYPGILFGRGSTNSVEDRENGDLGAVAL